MLDRDIHDIEGLIHNDVVGLNFVKANPPYVFRRHYRTGLRSHIMAVLDPEDVRREREGVVSVGVRCYPRARPIVMLRIFRKRFRNLSHAEEELQSVKTIEGFLGPEYAALSNEFLVDLRVRAGREILLCGLQEYVEGEMLDPWGCLNDSFLNGIQIRPGIGNSPGSAEIENADWLMAVRREALIFVDSIRKMATRAFRIPDLAGVGNLLLTKTGRIKLVDINNVSKVSFDGGIELDDRGYPVCDKSVEALWRLEKFLGGREPDPEDPLYGKYLSSARMREVKTLEMSFHAEQSLEAPFLGAN